MRRTWLCAVIVMVVLSMPSAIRDIDTDIPLAGISNSPLSNSSWLASAGGDGSDTQSVAYATRRVNGRQLDVLNTYISPEDHNQTLSLSEFMISGWTLYKVTLDTFNITAAPERKTVGISDSPSTGFPIRNYTNDYYYNQLTQGFYNLSHDGVLLNYSAAYFSLDYNIALRGTAYLVVRSDYSNTASNVTMQAAMDEHATGFLWKPTNGEYANLTKDTIYYATIDGRDLHKDIIVDKYPTIFWGTDPAAGSFETKRYSTEFAAWSVSMNHEALLNYTYLPWNQTAGAALTYGNPESVGLRINATSITGSSCTFSSSTGNITSLAVDTNQSVYMPHNLTLWYRQAKTSNTMWKAETSGGDIAWNVTTNLEYPSFTNLASRYHNLTIPNDWTTTGLYNSSSPSDNYQNYTALSTTVNCANMTNGTWTVTFTANNYVASVQLFDASDDTLLTTRANIELNVDVNTTIRNEFSNPVSTGTTNLTIVHEGSTVWTPANDSAATGTTHYLWDISSTTSDNGIFLLDVFWSNGTEAGYVRKTIVVFFPTSLTALQTAIEAYTEDSFEVRAYFEDTFTSQGLDGTLANLTYSFDGSANTSMFDHSNGTWTADVSTSGKGPGEYQVEVFGEGFAIENRSITIDVTLIHETQPLLIQWSGGNDITYVNSTDLVVVYRRVNGQNVSDAIVNVTIGTNHWNLTWDDFHKDYRLTFNGSDVPPGFGTHSLSIEVWKAGYQAQSNSSQQLILRLEPTNMAIEWSNGNSITYVEYTVLSVNFTMSNYTPIVGAIVNATIGSTPWKLVWNNSTKVYEVRFDGDNESLGIDIHPITIMAWTNGYEHKTNNTETLTIQVEPTIRFIVWNPGFDVTYTEYTIFSFSYWMSNGTAIPEATVNVTIGTNNWTLRWNPADEAYQIRFNGSDNPPGLGTHNLNVKAWKKGYENKSDSSQWLTLREEPTALAVSWSEGNNITYAQYTILIVNYTTIDGTAIINAFLNVTIGSDIRPLVWNEVTETYEITYYGSDDPPGPGNHSLTIRAWKHGYQDQTNSSTTLTLPPVPTSIQMNWTNGDNITYLMSTMLIVNYTMFNGTTVTGAIVNVTIGSDNWTLSWNGFSKTYTIRFNGSDSPPGFGVHTLTIQAWKYGYQGVTDNSQTLIMRRDPTTIHVTWTRGNNISYIEDTTLSVNYRMSNGSEILGASVFAATTESELLTLIWNATAQAYQVTIHGVDDPPGLGTFVVSIAASKQPFYADKNAISSLTIRAESTSLVTSWITYTFDWVESVILSINYTDSLGRLIGDATQRDVMINGTLYSLQGTNGTYWIELDNTFDLGYHSVEVTIDKHGYDVAFTDLISFDIVKAETHLLIEISSLTIFYDEASLVNISYRMINGTIVPGGGGLCTLVIDGTGQALTWQTNYWTTSFNGVLWGEGIHHCIVTGAAPEYQTATYEFDITVNLIPTQVLTDPSLSVYVTDQVNTSLLYMNTRDSEFLEADDVTVVWAGGYEIVRLVNDTYILTLFTAGMHNGTFSVQVNMSKIGFVSVSWLIAVTINHLPTELSSEMDVVLYENETLYMSVEFIDTYHATPISLAAVSLIFESTEYHLEYISTQQGYLVDLWLGPTISPGIYTLTITARAVDYTDAQIVVSLTVLAKERYSLVIETPVEVTEGSTLSVEVTATSNSEPVGGLSIEVHIIATDASGNQVEWVESGTTNAQGIATIDFDISAGITELEIWAEFVGSVSEWKVVSEERIIMVRSSAVDPISILTALLRDPVMLSLVVGTPSAAILVVLLKRRRIPTKMKALRPRGSEISLAQVSGTSVMDGFNIMQLVGSENLVYNMTKNGHLLIVDTVDSLADALEESSSHILDRLVYLGSLGLVTSITMSAKSKGPLKILSESAHREDRLRQEIMTSDAGLTRADVSKALGISSAKVGSLVRDLLASDSRFYEVREGKKRFIRYRNSE